MPSHQIPTPSARESEFAPLNRIRVETALSRYPVHRLAKHGNINIELSEANERGDITFRWEVSHNSKYGQPGPLAYKVDTLIINRRIEEASRPIPKIIKLDSLRDICRELGVNEGQATRNVKKSLYQNASAFITAKVRYKLADGTERTVEFGDTRYAVVFTGEKLPDGRTADAVYIVLHDFYREILDNVLMRPLDYDYLKKLPPAPQRFYELLSYQIYAAQKYNRRTARFAYSELCTHAPLTRHFEWHRVRSQMNKIHRPHKNSGYLAKVQYNQTTDADGHPDWLIIYTPGPKAEAEFRTFTKRGERRTLEIQQARPALSASAPAQADSNPLEWELTSRGVTASTAHELVTHYPVERITAQVEHFDWLKEKHPKKVKENPGGYLADSIRKDYAAPKGFESEADREKRKVSEKAQRQKEQEEARRKEADKHRERELARLVSERWESMTTAEQAACEAQALSEVSEEYRRQYEEAKPAAARRALMNWIRGEYLKKLIERDAAH
jgi:hypothetical protein